jgi:hypothetical protein
MRDGTVSSTAGFFADLFAVAQLAFAAGFVGNYCSLPGQYDFFILSVVVFGMFCEYHRAALLRNFEKMRGVSPWTAGKNVLHSAESRHGFARLPFFSSFFPFFFLRRMNPAGWELHSGSPPQRPPVESFWKTRKQTSLDNCL